MKLFRRKKEEPIEKTIAIINLSAKINDLEEIIIDVMLKSKEFGVVLNNNGDRMVIHKSCDAQGFGAIMGKTNEVKVDPFTFNREKHRITLIHEGVVDRETYRLIKYFNFSFSKVKIKEEKECQK